MCARHAPWVTGLIVALSFSAVRGQVTDPTYDPETPARRGQAGMVFLGIGGSARADAMGGAFSSVQADPSSVFYNVAGMAGVPRGFAGYFNRTDWLADMTTDHVVLSYRSGTVTTGLSFVGMNYGRIRGTVIDLAVPDGYRLTGHLEPKAWAVGTFLALPLTDQFSFGIQVKYATQDFGAQSYWITTSGIQGYYTYTAADLRVATFAVDIGSQYNTGLRGITVAMAMQNFARPQKFVNGSFDLPLTYRIGVATDVVELVAGLPNQNHALRLCVDAVDARDALLDAAFGAEYEADLSSLAEGLSVALRGGRRAGDQEGTLSVGGGITVPIGRLRLGLDYAYCDYGPAFAASQWGLKLVLP